MSDDILRARVHEIFLTTKEGERLTKQAGLRATKEMAKLVNNIGSEEARVLALEHHALYIGIGNEFMDLLLPLIQSMKSDLKEIEGMTDLEAGVLRSLYLGKVFKNIIEAGRIEL